MFLSSKACLQVLIYLKVVHIFPLAWTVFLNLFLPTILFLHQESFRQFEILIPMKF